MAKDHDDKVNKARSQIKNAIESALKITDLGFRAIVLRHLCDLATLYGFHDIADQIKASEQKIKEEEMRLASLDAYGEARRAEAAQQQAQSSMQEYKKALGTILDNTLNILGFVSNETKADIAKTGRDFHNSMTPEIKTVEKLSIGQTVKSSEIKDMLNYLGDKTKSAPSLNAAEKFDKSISNAINEVRATPEGKKKYTELDPKRKFEVDALEVSRAPAAKLMVADRNLDLQKELKYHINQHVNEKDSGIETESFAQKFFADRKRNSIQETIENIKGQHTHDKNKKSMVDLVAEQEGKDAPSMGRSK